MDGLVQIEMSKNNGLILNVNISYIVPTKIITLWSFILANTQLKHTLNWREFFGIASKVQLVDLLTASPGELLLVPLEGLRPRFPLTEG